AARGLDSPVLGLQVGAHAGPAPGQRPEDALLVAVRVQHVHGVPAQLVADAPYQASGPEVVLAEDGYPDLAPTQLVGKAPLREENRAQLQLGKLTEPGNEVRHLDLGSRPQVAGDEMGHPDTSGVVHVTFPRDSPDTGDPRPRSRVIQYWT